MTLSIPYALWGLLGLVIPIFIHLFSKKERNVVHFGSLKFLQSFDSESARSIQLSRLLLLLLRLIFIGLLCFLMTRPLVRQNEKSNLYWIESELQLSDYKNVMHPELIENDDVMRFTFDQKNTDNSQYFHSAWSFIDYLNGQEDSSTVYGFSLLSNFKGPVIPLMPHVKWQYLPKKQIQNKSELINRRNFSTEWSVVSDSYRTDVTSNIINDIPDGPLTPPIKIKLIGDSENKYAEIIKTVIDLTGFYLPYNIEWTNENDEQWTIIIGDSWSELPENFIQWSPSSELLKIDYYSKSQAFLCGQINKEEILRTNLPVVLASMLNKYFTGIDHLDDRILHPDYMKRTEDRNTIKRWNTKRGQKSLATFWWLILVPVLLVERILSYRSNLK